MGGAAWLVSNYPTSEFPKLLIAFMRSSHTFVKAPDVPNQRNLGSPEVHGMEGVTSEADIGKTPAPRCPTCRCRSRDGIRQGNRMLRDTRFADHSLTSAALEITFRQRFWIINKITSPFSAAACNRSQIPCARVEKGWAVPSGSNRRPELGLG